MSADNQARFRAALPWLLPTGPAWPRDADSVLMAAMRGLADAFGELQDVTEQAVREWQPHTTQQRLAEWEEACGLPDPCWDASTDLEVRRAAVLVRLQGAPRAYPDSSPAAPAALEALCATLGVTAAAVVNYPFRVGQGVGNRLGRNGWLYVVVDGSWTSLEQAQWTQRITCALEAVVPARYAIHVHFSGA